jgi:hypothetical protein
LTFGKMTSRQRELAHFASKLSWLPADAAGRDFSVAREATSTERYGLDEQRWEVIERWDVEHAGEDATRSRLARHAIDSEVIAYFGPQDVCRMSRETFLAHWQDMFMPSRDDVVVMPPSGVWCLFYCHEDEFEAGRRRTPNKAPEPTP